MDYTLAAWEEDGLNRIRAEDKLAKWLPGITWQGACPSYGYLGNCKGTAWHLALGTSKDAGPSLSACQRAGLAKVQECTTYVLTCQKDCTILSPRSCSYFCSKTKSSWQSVGEFICEFNKSVLYDPQVRCLVWRIDWAFNLAPAVLMLRPGLTRGNKPLQFKKYILLL